MTTALVLIALFALVTYATFATIHGDRPKAAPRSHATDPDFLPVVRWP